MHAPGEVARVDALPPPDGDVPGNAARRCGAADDQERASGLREPERELDADALRGPVCRRSERARARGRAAVAGSPRCRRSRVAVPARWGRVRPAGRRRRAGGRRRRRRRLWQPRQRAGPVGGGEITTGGRRTGGAVVDGGGGTVGTDTVDAGRDGTSASWSSAPAASVPAATAPSRSARAPPSRCPPARARAQTRTRQGRRPEESVFRTGSSRRPPINSLRRYAGRRQIGTPGGYWGVLSASSAAGVSATSA